MAAPYCVCSAVSSSEVIEAVEGTSTVSPGGRNVYCSQKQTTNEGFVAGSVYSLYRNGYYAGNTTYCMSATAPVAYRSQITIPVRSDKDIFSGKWKKGSK